MRPGRALALWLALAPGAAAAGETGWQARIEAAAEAVATAEGAAERLDRLTRLIAAQEAGQAQIREEMRGLAIAEAGTRGHLARQQSQLARLLPVLERLQPGAAPLPLLHPGGALAAVQAAALTADLAAAIGREQAVLAERLDALQQTRAALENADRALSALRDDTAGSRQALIAAAAARGPLPPGFDTEAASARALAQGLDSVAGLTAGLEPSAPAGKAPRDLPLPVAAKPVVSGDGWRLSPGTEALVRAPAAGTVLYAGPLRGHRLVIVEELAPGRLLVLAGLGTLLVQSGTAVAAGQALGFLPPAEPDHTNVTPAQFPAGSLPRDTLYMEARDANRPVDPAMWFPVE